MTDAFDGKTKQRNLIDFILNAKNKARLTVMGVIFYDPNPNSDVFSLFQGFKYATPLDIPINMPLIQPFLDFIKEVICRNKKILYNYVIGWISNIMQNIGFKNEVAIVLRGLQGTGKNTFTNTLCEMMSGYSESNITDIDELSGTFNSVVESKMLLVLNELQDTNGKPVDGSGRLKSMLTEYKFRRNEKHQARYTAQNVGNFILLTNNANPVFIEPDDRRFFVVEVNPVHKKDRAYWSRLYALIGGENNNPPHNVEFYEELTRYFRTYNINQFDVTDIPMTREKRQAIKWNMQPLEMFLTVNYAAIYWGLQKKELDMLIPTYMKDRDKFKDKLEQKLHWRCIREEECAHKGIPYNRKNRSHYYFFYDMDKETYAPYAPEIEEDVEEEEEECETEI